MRKIVTATAALAFACIPALTAVNDSASPAITAEAASYFTTTATGYTKASDVDYVTASGYTVNWGARGEDCTFLSSKALAFYTGSNTYEAFSQKSGGTSQSNAPQSALYSALKSFMTSKHTRINSYKENNTLLRYTDCTHGSGKISSFYSGKEIGPDWDSAATWNKEHTWPNSKGLAGSDEDDVMMIRPTWVQENSSRGNTAYGQSNGYYDPNELGANVRGDCARIVLYVYTRWGNTSYMWGQSGVMESMDVLLQWMQEDPVDTWEMGRNDAVQSITGTRNVFVDYPELAFQLFGESVPTGMTTPSGGAGSGGSVTPDTPVVPDTPDEPDTPVTPDTPSDNALATFEFGDNKSASHNDGANATSKTYTANGYELNVTGGSQLYVDANDAKGNSCLKLGSSKSVGSFTFTVPGDVERVVIQAAKYKTNAATLKVNGQAVVLNTNSNDGEYTEITVDTSSTKTVSVETVSGSTRVMINSISFFGAETPDVPIVPDEPIEPDVPIVPDDSSNGNSSDALDSSNDISSDSIPEDVISGLTESGCAATLSGSAILTLLPIAGYVFTKKKD